MSLEASMLGDFTVVSRLGEGGSGTVYAAWWRAEPVALKVLRASVAVTEKERARFFDEAAKLRKVEHPALVRVLEAGTLPDGRPYLVMPRLQGETLGERLARGPLDPAEAVEIFARLADGVGAIHDAGLVHRDIKPENVFLEETECGAQPVLLDFGIARDMDRPESTTTQAGVVRGTPAYMAPERFFGTAAGVRTDVYELAVVLYMMLVGKLPWDPKADNASGRLQPPPPSALGASVPAALDKLLLRAMSTRPEVRPASARAFADEIRAAAASPAVSAPPARRTAAFEVTSAPTTTGSTVIERQPPPAKRRTFLLAAAAGVAALGIVALGVRRHETPEPAAATTLTPAVVAIPAPTPTPIPIQTPTPTPEPTPKPSHSALASRTLTQSPSPPPPHTPTPPSPRYAADPPAPAPQPSAADPSRFYVDRK